MKNTDLKDILNTVFAEENYVEVDTTINDGSDSVVGGISHFKLDSDNNIIVSIDSEEDSIDVPLKSINFSDFSDFFGFIVVNKNYNDYEVCSYASDEETSNDSLIEAVSNTISNFDEYTSCDVENIKEQGYENYGAGKVFILDLETAIRYS